MNQADSLQIQDIKTEQGKKLLHTEYFSYFLELNKLKNRIRRKQLVS